MELDMKIKLDQCEQEFEFLCNQDHKVFEYQSRIRNLEQRNELLEEELLKFKTREAMLNKSIVDQLQDEASMMAESRERMNSVLKKLSSENAQLRDSIRQQEQQLSIVESQIVGDEEEKPEMDKIVSEPIVDKVLSEPIVDKDLSEPIVHKVLSEPIMDSSSFQNDNPKTELQFCEASPQSMFEPTKEYSVDSTWSFIDQLLQIVYVYLLSTPE